jgi:predicted DNA-binding protein with PD1-like motif
MKTIAVRIPEGEDLVQEIERVVAENHIQAGVILSGVGGLTKSKIRVPVIDGEMKFIYPEDLEIVSLNGTVSLTGIHIHISGSDVDGKVWGGHLKQGSVVRMTCELVIGVLEDTVFERKPDEETGYSELHVSSS